MRIKYYAFKLLGISKIIDNILSFQMKSNPFSVIGPDIIHTKTYFNSKNHRLRINLVLVLVNIEEKGA